MKKRALLVILLVIVLVSSVFAQDEYAQGATATVGSHIVKVENIGTNSVIFSVDGVKNIVSLSQTKIINGVEITVTDIFYVEEVSARSTKALLTAVATVSGVSNITTAGKCGDSKCDEGESETNCCSDCGCPVNKSCVDNKCLTNECEEDEECWNIPDRDFCIKYRCEGMPKKCTQTPITECVINDKCCPGFCFYPDDSDCPTTKIGQTKTIPKVNATNESKITVTLEERASFFKKIVNWFLNLFRKNK